jgi:6-phosphogluconolactonase
MSGWPTGGELGAGDRSARISSEIQVYENPRGVAAAAAELLVDEAEAAIRERGRFCIALAGGETPRLLYETLAAEHAGRIDWPCVHLFWGDERCVDDQDPQSNYRMVYEALLSRVSIPPGNVHRIRGEHPDPHGAAIEYDRLLKRFFSFESGGPKRPFDGSGRAADETPAGLRKEGPASRDARTTFDVVLLGLGEDGHTASLFPGDPVLQEMRHWVYAVRAPKGVTPAERVTLTLPAFAAASRVVFLVTGERKQAVLDAVRGGGAHARDRYPAARVTAANGVLWLTDAAAAGLPPA